MLELLISIYVRCNISASGGGTLPFSSTNGKRFIQSCVDLLKHKGSYKVLDLGAGSGGYSTLFRSQLKGHWTAIEIWEPYVAQFRLNGLYDQVIVEDALHFLKRIPGQTFDVAFAGDMLEHMTKTDAALVLKELNRTCRLAFVSVPIGEYPQPAFMGNPYEEHLATWHQADLETIPGARLHHYEGEIGVAVLGYLPLVIQAYCITKNELKFFSRMSRSVGEYTGQGMVVCDTGSTDGTLELAQAESHELLSVIVTPFRFDDARNAALGAVSLAVDYVISIDADELIPHGRCEHLAKAILAELGKTGNLPDVVNHSFRTVWDWEGEGKHVTSHFHSRVHRRTGCRWIHPVHEKLSWFDGNPKQMWYTDLLLEQRPDGTKDRSSYLPALRIAVNEDPTDWKLLSFIADEVSSLSYDEAQGYLELASKLPDSDKAFISLKQGFLAERWAYPTIAEKRFQYAMTLNGSREYAVHWAEFLQRCGAEAIAIAHAWATAKDRQVETHGYVRREDCWNGSIPQLR